MGVITNISIPGEWFELGHTLQQSHNPHARFEQLIPTDGIFPCLWVTVEDHETFLETAQSNPYIDTIERVHRKDDEGLYEIEWRSHTDGFLQCIRETEPSVLRATGTARRWQFELRFRSHEALSSFQEHCIDAGLSPTFDRIINDSARQSPGDDLTQTQRETIELALQNGYFDVPRQTTIVELAEEFGISDQAISARIRRGMKTLAENAVLSSDHEADEREEMSVKEA